MIFTPVPRADVETWARLGGTFDAWRALEAASTAQLSNAIFLCVVWALAALAAHWSVVGVPRLAFLTASALVAAVSVMTGGSDDVRHHIFRTAWLASRLWEGEMSLLVDDPITGEVYPIFVFYSLLPYALPVALDLAGFGAVFSYRVSLGLYVLLFSAGVFRLAESHVAVRGAPTPNRSQLHFAALFLVTSLPVATTFATRSAFAEATTLALIPWAVLALRSRSALPFLFLLSTQIALHPVVFPQTFAAVAILGMMLDSRPPLCAIHRLVIFTPIALLISAPFWAPQAVWLSAIGGHEALRVPYAETFHTISTLLSPIEPSSPGVPMFVALLIVMSRPALLSGARFACMTVALLVILFLQTEHLRDVTMLIPFLDKGQFVTRLMPLAVLLCFGLAILGIAALPSHATRVLGGIATIFLALTIVTENARQRALVLSAPTNAEIERAYL